VSLVHSSDRVATHCSGNSGGSADDVFDPEWDLFDGFHFHTDDD
jgi:hypothetical protein